YNCRRGVMRSDHRHLTAYQIGCEVGQPIVLVLRPAILDHDILALDVTGFANALPECGQIACTISKRRAAEKPDHRHRRLLRASCKRPRNRAAEQRDEFASSYGEHEASPPGKPAPIPLSQLTASSASRRGWASPWLNCSK